PHVLRSSVYPEAQSIRVLGRIEKIATTPVSVAGGSAIAEWKEQASPIPNQAEHGEPASLACHGEFQPAGPAVTDGAVLATCIDFKLAQIGRLESRVDHVLRIGWKISQARKRRLCLLREW